MVLCDAMHPALPADDYFDKEAKENEIKQLVGLTLGAPGSSQRPSGTSSHSSRSFAKSSSEARARVARALANGGATSRTA